MPRCIDCVSLDLRAAAKLNLMFPRLGLAKCSRRDFGSATFITTTYARECASFEPADAEIIARREQYLNQAQEAEPS